MTGDIQVVYCIGLDSDVPDYLAEAYKQDADRRRRRHKKV